MKAVAHSFSRKNYVRMAGFFLLFAVLSNLCYIPCYFYMRQMTRENSMEQYRKKLEDGVKKLETTIDALSSLQTMLNQNMNYRMISYLRGGMSDTEIATMCAMISTYMETQDLAWESGVSREDEILLTRRRIYYHRDGLGVEDFFSQKGLTTADFLDQFTGSACVLPQATFESVTYREYQAITIAWRWSKVNDVYFFATFPVKGLLESMADEGVLAAGRVTVFWGDTALVSQGNALAGDFEQLEQSTDWPDLRITVQIPNRYIEEDLTQFRHLVNAFLIFMLVASITWVIACTLSAARPLNRVAELLYSSNHLRGELEPGQGIALDLARELKQLDSRIENYEDTIAEQNERLRMQTLERTLYRGLYNKESRAAFQGAFPNFPLCWRMAWLQYTSEEQDIEPVSLLPLFTAFLQRELSRAIVLNVDQNTLLVILSSGPDEYPAAALEKLRDEARRQYAIVFDTLLSEIHDDPKELAETYQQLEYMATVETELGGAMKPQRFPLSVQQMQTMYMALSCGDESVSLGTLKDCAQAVRKAADFVLSKHTYRMISNILVMIKLESRCNLNDIVIPLFSRDDILDLFERQLPGCFLRICQRIAQQKQTVTQFLVDGVMAYIDEHLSSPELCINMVTDAFHISAPTLQKRLHTAAGMTFSAYVENARMNKARTMLRETTLSAQEISEACGYAASNSFYKAYKRCFGEPPLAVRK